MKYNYISIDDLVDKWIFDFPLLYLNPNKEVSRDFVLNQLFIVLGNGCKWVETDNGYSLLDSYDDKDCYPLNQVEKDYLSSVYNNTHFCNREGTLYYPRNKKYKKWYVSNIEEIPVEVLNCDWRNKDVDDFFNYEKYPYGFLDIDKMSYIFDNIYPNFSDEYSKYYNINPDDIAPDWKKAMIEHLYKCKQIFLSLMFNNSFNVLYPNILECFEKHEMDKAVQWINKTLVLFGEEEQTDNKIWSIVPTKELQEIIDIYDKKRNK